MVKVSKAVVIGVDPHKRINAVVVVDAAGEVLDRGHVRHLDGGPASAGDLRTPVHGPDVGGGGL